jgi:hypothetical protein
MFKIFTIEFVKAEFKKENYKLLSTEYINASTKLEYICPKNHKHFINWNSWQQGHRCPYCCGRAKLTIEFIKKEFKKKDYILLTKVYKNSKQKLDYICPKGHKSSIIWDSWKAGHGCPYCANNVKLNIEFVKKEFKKEGYVLLTVEYKDSKQKLNYVCPKGHKHSISWSKWKFGRRCPRCSAIRIGKKLRLGIDFIRKEFKKEGYILLTTEYENSNQKLDYICPKGHKHNISWGSWQNGSRCYYCHGTIKPTIGFIKAEFKKAGYTLLTKVYRNGLQKLEYVCPIGHNHAISWGNWKNGYRCPICAVIKNSGPTHYNWQGGISCEPYCQNWTKEFKEFIKERDSYRCQNPYCNSKNPKDLTVHHIDYNKKNCGSENLITVCRSCNSKANTDRTWHKSWYQAVLYRKYYDKENRQCQQ